jgi:DNA-binding HxlR family transcriptional regulator
MSLRVRKNRAVVPPDVRPDDGPITECPLTSCMDLLGGAWAPHVLWFLGAQPRRFGELRLDIPKISARVLSQRLRELEARGVITRTVVPTSPPSAEYALSDLGRELMPVIEAIVAVGRKLQKRPTPPQRRRRGSSPGPGAPITARAAPPGWSARAARR